MLSTKYLGLSLKNPVIAGASGFTGNIKTIKKLEDAGIGAVVIKSLFEEQIQYEVNQSISKGGTIYGYSDIDDYVGFYEKKHNVSKYLNLIKDAKQSTNIPVIASINCVSNSQWEDFAGKISETGADALQLNMFVVPFDTKKSGSDLESAYIKTIEAVKKEITIPLSVKIGYHFSNIFQMISRMAEAGVDGFVLFNRFFTPDIDINTLNYTSTNFFSDPSEASMPLRWIGQLFGRINTSLASSTGVHSGEDLIKMILVGADASEIVSTLYKNKPVVIRQMLDTLQKWMESHNFSTIDAFKGLKSQKDSDNPEVFNRLQYMKRYGDLQK